MKKLLLSSVSVMAFVTAASQAAELPVTADEMTLSATAQQQLASQMIVPEIDMNALVKAQTLSVLSEESLRVLGKSLYALNEEGDSVTPPAVAE